MVVSSTYWRLVRLDGLGRLTVKEIASAKAFFQSQFPDFNHPIEISDIYIQRQLFKLLSQDHINYRTAQECLRCFISNQIERVCIQLEIQFGREHGFTRYDLFPFVLDDTFNDLSSETSQFEQTSYKPMTLKILQTFNPDRGSLTTWTIRLVKHHQELNTFLLEHGVYLVSDWAILNDTTPKQLQRILGDFHNLTGVEVEQAKLLLESYHLVYRQERLKQRQKGQKGKCPPPSIEQLQNMNDWLSQQRNHTFSPEKILSLLQDLAERLRQYRIYARGGFSGQDSFDNPDTRLMVEQKISAESNSSNNDNDFIDFLKAYRYQFIKCLDKALEKVTQSYYSRLQHRDSQKAELFLKALELFHCQHQAMGDIASSIGLQAQYQVTRLLKLKEFRADTRQLMLKDLLENVLTTSVAHLNPEQLSHQEQQIEIALDEQINTVIQEAIAEASAPKHHTQKSLFAQRLCFYLYQLRKKSL